MKTPTTVNTPSRKAAHPFDASSALLFAVLSIGNSQSSNGTMTLSDIGGVGIEEDGGVYGGIALGVQRRRFVHRHSADRVEGHIGSSREVTLPATPPR